MTDILMPALSPTMEEGVLAKWHVKAGDTISSGDVIAEIETDKATMEVEAVDEGVVEAILVPEGTEGVKVNSPIARLKGDAEATPPTQPKAAESKAPVGGATSDDPRAARDQGQQEARERQADPSAKSPEPSKANGAAAPASPPAAVASNGDGRRVFASPLARRLAGQKGVDLSGLKGSGPHGRIIASDVEGAQPGAAPMPQAASPTPTEAKGAQPSVGAQPQAPVAQAKSLASLGIAAGSYDLVPLDGMRKTIARRLTESFRDIPHFPLTLDLEIDRLLDARVRINAALEKQGAKVSVNDILIKASALALKAVPGANASYTAEGIALHHHADVAVAVAIEGGLITPIIREAESRSLLDISKAMKDLAARARDRKLKPEEFQGGTFSLSNLGMFGIKSFSSIINEPQGMILSVGAGEKRPVVRGDQLAVGTVMTVTLTCDHRVVDGATGAQWLQAFKAFVEEPLTMIA
jgi:pyruvate dehydrogenase E2 component (dihydrolipoamide acetyltransferase)